MTHFDEKYRTGIMISKIGVVAERALKSAPVNTDELTRKGKCTRLNEPIEINRPQVHEGKTINWQENIVNGSIRVTGPGGLMLQERSFSTCKERQKNTFAKDIQDPNSNQSVASALGHVGT
ncbi:hypothetical protein Y032_0727g1880 [Ancylostoma ceylanicum]|uniref:Uncharacterized protein n=1 Tax=Ancylostoma ceylanicum TaxID=53326 RepID=A0A016WEL1_9BILA|nr:hypothetical protein Y032_0727g1880 [Ancylostoma ceylanicum]